MAQSVSSGNTNSGEDRVEKLQGALVVNDVIIKQRVKVVEVPELKYVVKEVEYEKPVAKEVETIIYVPREEGTVKFTVEEKEIIKYNVKDVEVERPIITEREYERPTIKDKEYERPVIVEKVYEVITPTDIESIKELKNLMVDMREEIAKLKAELAGLKSYKLVEDVVKVPKLKWETVNVERIVWKDVER
jgi:cytochrome c biogenesis protein ResB